MPLEAIGLIGLLFMFLLMFMRVPIAIAMAIPAIVGIWYLRDWKVVATAIETIVWSHSYNYLLTTIPMFVLMGELLYSSGISSELFSAFHKCFGKLRGGLAMATIGSSAIFAAASGSSLATTGTIGAIASKEMLKAGYNKALIGGSIVAGGSLGILIPPSMILILYGVLADESIGKLFIAGIVPGILLTLLFMLAIAIAVFINPSLAQKGGSSTWKEKLLAFRDLSSILLLFVIVIGGMYIGLFSPTESAAIGAFGAFVIALARKKLTWKNLVESLLRTLSTTGFLFAIVLSAFILNYFLSFTKLPITLAEFVMGLDLPRGLLFSLIIVMYILLGAVMDSMAMVVVTVPVLLPLIQELGFDLIWFGVIIVIVVEMALITPPVGMNCFVLYGVAPELKLGNIFKGGLWFIIPLLVLVVLMYMFPEIVLYLPSHMR